MLYPINDAYLLIDLKSIIVAILGDIKKDIDNGERTREAATAAMLQTMRDALEGQQQEPVPIDNVAAMIAGQLVQLVPMDEKTMEQFQQLAKKMMERAGNSPE